MTKVKDLDCAECAKPLANETHAVAEDWKLIDWRAQGAHHDTKTVYLCPACGDDVDE